MPRMRITPRERGSFFYQLSFSFGSASLYLSVAPSTYTRVSREFLAQKNVENVKLPALYSLDRRGAQKWHDIARYCIVWARLANVKHVSYQFLFSLPTFTIIKLKFLAYRVSETSSFKKKFRLGRCHFRKTLRLRSLNLSKSRLSIGPHHVR